MNETARKRILAIVASGLFGVFIGGCGRLANAVKSFNSDVAEATGKLDEYLKGAHAGEELQNVVEGSIAVSAGPGFEPLIDTRSVTSHESGTVLFNGRRLPAIIIRVRMEAVNRAEGKHGAACLFFAGVLDREFKVWRGMVSGDVDHNGSLGWSQGNGLITPEDWKKAVGYERSADSETIDTSACR